MASSLAFSLSQVTITTSGDEGSPEPLSGSRSAHPNVPVDDVREASPVDWGSFADTGSQIDWGSESDDSREGGDAAPRLSAEPRRDDVNGSGSTLQGGDEARGSSVSRGGNAPRGENVPRRGTTYRYRGGNAPRGLNVSRDANASRASNVSRDGNTSRSGPTTRGAITARGRYPSAARSTSRDGNTSRSGPTTRGAITARGRYPSAARSTSRGEIASRQATARPASAARSRPTAAAPAPPVGAAAIAVTRLPPPTDRIWGLTGMCHGIAPKVGGKHAHVTVLDERYRREKRPANVFGHNGLTPGDWFPNQLVALFHGAHGMSQGGVYGKAGQGTYSVVVSGQYKDVDNDRGDTIIYSGPGSQENLDKHNLPAGSSTTALLHSLPHRDGRPGHPVRVLRSSKGSRLSPAVGIRYDGLYQVEQRLPDQTNSKGGLYCRFVLKRVPDQESLDNICTRSPTMGQKMDHRRMWDLSF